MHVLKTIFLYHMAANLQYIELTKTSVKLRIGCLGTPRNQFLQNHHVGFGYFVFVSWLCWDILSYGCIFMVLNKPQPNVISPFFNAAEGFEFSQGIHKKPGI